jgi:hypothetical protein
MRVADEGRRRISKELIFGALLVDPWRPQRPRAPTARRLSRNESRLGHTKPYCNSYRNTSQVRRGVACARYSFFNFNLERHERMKRSFFSLSLSPPPRALHLTWQFFSFFSFFRTWARTIETKETGSNVEPSIPEGTKIYAD